MFQFAGFPPRGYVFTARYIRCSLCGFPHSDTRGSSCVCHSPRLFAAYRVFLRPPVPRHPPCALLRLTLPRTPSVARAACFFSLFFCVWYYFFAWYSVFKVRPRHKTPQWRLRDSNSRPPACKAGALPAELSPLPHGMFPVPSLSLFFFCSGSRLLSHAVPSIVSSAARVLTIVFGMGTGVPPGRIATGCFPFSAIMACHLFRAPRAALDD